MSARSVAQARYANAKRWRPEEDHADLRRDLAAERLAEAIGKIVDNAPPLTPEQRRTLTSLLRGGS